MSISQRWARGGVYNAGMYDATRPGKAMKADVEILAYLNAAYYRRYQLRKEIYNHPIPIGFLDYRKLQTEFHSIII
ncbi:MAG: hypothetical protein ACXQTR_04785 [Candidatus Methanospirareceae archaeon]